MKGKVHFIQLGCDKNRVDGEVMLGLLDAAGYEITPEPETADAIIVNTCGFISEAVRESIETVLEAAEHKKNGCRAIIVSGCMSTRYREEIIKEIPEVDAVVSVKEYANIAAVLNSLLADASAVSAAPEINGDYWNSLRLAGRKMTASPHIAYVKISEGCDNRCTYCTIPSIRGPYVERAFGSIIDECKQLVADGARELVFVAQDTARHSRIADLLREVSNVNGLTWLRLMYAYPEHITDGLIEAMAASEKICPYIDMPIQHVSNTVLKRMGRKSTRDYLTEVIGKLRERIPGIAIRTTLMVGFPGETEAEFNELCEFAREIRFDRLGVFVYSPEDGTPAAKMKGKIKKAEAHARRDKLMVLQHEIHNKKQRGFIGREINVMADKIKAEDAAVTGVGRTVRDAPEVDAAVIFKFPADKIITPGEIIKIRVTDANDYDLVGETV